VTAVLFNSPEFLFFFLPIFLAIYYLAPRGAQNFVVFASSLLFYLATSGELTAVLLLSVVINHFFAQWIHKAKGSKRNLLLAIGVFVNLAPLIYYKGLQ
jgi:alginate O-acetyltransferase complex protein AlgI